MSFWETILAVVLAQIPTYFIQRYFFKHIMDKSLEKVEKKAWDRIKLVWGGGKNVVSQNPA